MKSVIDSIVSNKGNILLIDLWTNNNRIKDILGGTPHCSHSSIVGDYCTDCGAFVGYIGEEKDWQDFIYHLQIISHIMRDSEFFMISRKYVPEYINNQDKNFLIDNSFSHNRSTTYFPREGLYLTHFYSKHTPSNYKLSVSRQSLPSYLSTCCPIDVLINPSKDIQHSLSYLPYEKCNSNINYF